jgi:hypothetical protein
MTGVGGRILDPVALATQIGDFAKRIEPAEARWSYCLERRQYTHRFRSGEVGQCIRETGTEACNRILGTRLNPSSLRLRLGLLHREGYAAAHEHYTRYGGNGLSVGPLEAWNIGHVYFLRLSKHPHIFKIGFSRRLADRIDDIRSKTGAGMVVHAVRVGTLLDEQWWHQNWRNHRISGEWFFEPASADRSRPDFLVEQKQAA